MPCFSLNIYAYYTTVVNCCPVKCFLRSCTAAYGKTKRVESVIFTIIVTIRCLDSSLLGSHTKTKPPPLLSLQQPPSLHNSYGGSSLLCSPLMQPLPPRHQGPRGSHATRGAPPSLKSSRPPLLSTPGGLLGLLSISLDASEN